MDFLNRYAENDMKTINPDGFEIIMEWQTNKKNWSEYLDGKAGWTIEKSKHNSFKKDIRECIKIAQS